MWEVGWTEYSGLFSPLLSGILLSPTGKLLFIPQSPPLVGPHGPVLWLGKSTPQPFPGASNHPSYRPTSNSSRSPAQGRNFLQMSMVKSVLLLLKMEVSDDMSAAIITAIISPRRPVWVRDRCYLSLWLAGNKNHNITVSVLYHQPSHFYRALQLTKHSHTHDFI